MIDNSQTDLNEVERQATADAGETDASPHQSGGTDASPHQSGGTDASPHQSGETDAEEHLTVSTGQHEIHASGLSNSVLTGDSADDHLYGAQRNDVLDGGDGADNLYGDAGNDSLVGGLGNDVLNGGAGNDMIDGGTGIDSSTYAGNRSNFTVTKSGTGFIANDNVGTSGTDTLNNIERLSFADGTLGLDTNGTSGEMYRLYQAAFNHVPDALGLGHNIRLVDGGMTLAQMADAFVVSAEFTNTYGTLSNAQFIDQLYLNVLNRAPDAAGLAHNLNLLDTNAVDRPGMLVAYSESAENQLAVIGQIQDGIWFT